MGVNEAAFDAKGDDVAGGRQGGLPHPLLQRRGQRSALGRQEGLPHPLLRRRGQRDHIFIDIVTILIKIRAKACYFRSKVIAAKKKGDRQHMLK